MGNCGGYLAPGRVVFKLREELQRGEVAPKDPVVLEVTGPVPATVCVEQVTGG